MISYINNKEKLNILDVGLFIPCIFVVNEDVSLQCQMRMKVHSRDAHF